MTTDSRLIRYAVAGPLAQRVAGATGTTTTPVVPRRAPVVKPVQRSAGGSPGVIAGYAILWDRLSLDLGGFKERVARGAVDETLKGIAAGTHDVLFQYAHEGQHLLGRTSSGHLKLSTDATGLRFEARLPGTTLARDLWQLVVAGILKGASIGFSLGIESWDRTGMTPVRTVKTMSLWEISVVSRPAYYMTSASAMRSAPTEGVWAAVRLRAAAAKPHRLTGRDALREDPSGIIRR